MNRRIKTNLSKRNDDDYDLTIEYKHDHEDVTVTENRHGRIIKKENSEKKIVSEVKNYIVTQSWVDAGGVEDLSAKITAIHVNPTNKDARPIPVTSGCTEV